MEQKPKKFVFQIYPENIDYVESLSYREKQDLINQLLAEYQSTDNDRRQAEKAEKMVKNIIITALVMLIGIPLLILMINISLNYTKANNTYMQKNFEKLF